jgi:hypothetical protein
MGSAIFGGASSRIPRPLVHRHEVDVGLVLNQRLCSVPVVNIPIDDQDSLEPMLLAGVVGGERDIAKETEPHGAVVDRMVPRRPDSGEAARVNATYRQVDGGQDTSRSGGGGVPRPAAQDGVSVESPTTVFGELFDAANVVGVVNELELLDGRAPALEMLDGVKKFGIFAKRAGNRA